MSYREETIDIISIAQQARPKVSGQTELDCAHAIAFSTANELRHRDGEAGPQPRTLLPSGSLSPLFQAALETTEEAVLNALLRATSVSGMGRNVEALPLDRVRATLEKYGRSAAQGRAAER